jgi:hypothetical protein
MRPFKFCVLGLSELALFGAQTLRCPQIEGKNSAEQAQNDGQTAKKCPPIEGEKPRFESLLVRGPNGRKWGRNPKQITAAQLEAEGIKKTPLLAVMRAMCLDCRSPEEVLVCARPYCPLWPYRDGTSPWKRDDRETR